MQKIGFAEALESVVDSDPRYQRDGYIFLRDALDFTTKQQKKVKGVSVRHEKSGAEIRFHFLRIQNAILNSARRSQQTPLHSESHQNH